MRDLNLFVFTGTVGHIEYKDDNNRPRTNVVVYCSDDYKKKDGTYENQSYRYSVSFFGDRAQGIFNAFQQKDKVWCSAKVIVVMKTDSNGNKTSNTYFNGVDISKSSVDNQASQVSQKGGKTKRPVSSRTKAQATVTDDDYDDDIDDLLDDEDIV